MRGVFLLLRSYAAKQKADINVHPRILTSVVAGFPTTTRLGKTVSEFAEAPLLSWQSCEESSWLSSQTCPIALCTDKCLLCLCLAFLSRGLGPYRKCLMQNIRSHFWGQSDSAAGRALDLYTANLQHLIRSPEHHQVSSLSTDPGVSPKYCDCGPLTKKSTLISPSIP